MEWAENGVILIELMSIYSKDHAIPIFIFILSNNILHSLYLVIFQKHFGDL